LIVKKVLAAMLLVAALGGSTPARAQVFGQFTSASIVPVNGHLFGAYLTASNNVFGGLAQLRLSFYPNVDFGFHGGLTRLDRGVLGADLTTLRLGTDLRWKVVESGASTPVDIAVGGALGVETSDDFKVISVGPSVVVSRTLGVGTSGGIVPYGGMALNFSSRDAFGVEDSDVSVPLRFGFEAKLAQEFRIVAELQLFVADRYNDDVGFATGVNLPF
jgi:hypothetical protein